MELGKNQSLDSWIEKVGKNPFPLRLGNNSS